MKKIAIIGASYLQLPLVKKAKDMGLETHCFAWEKGAVCAEYADFFYPISTINKEAILKECQQIGIDGIVSIASDIAVPTVNYVASHMNLPGNDDAFSDMVTNKMKMRECFAKNAVPSPKFHMTKTADVAGYTDNLAFPVIVKPTDRSGSRGVEKVETMEHLEEAVERALQESFAGEAIIEEYVDGCEVSVESISWQGKHYILQITDKVTTGAPHFVELEHHQPSSLPSNIQLRIKDIVRNALDALHIEYGASHSELKISDNGEIKIIEVGARMGGDFIGSDLVMLSTGYDFLKGVIEVSLGDFHTPQITTHKFSGVYFLSEETKHLKSIIENRKDNPEIVEAQITSSLLKHIECSGDRSGYLIYQSVNGKLEL